MSVVESGDPPRRDGTRAACPFIIDAIRHYASLLAATDPSAIVSVIAEYYLDVSTMRDVTAWFRYQFDAKAPEAM